MFHRPDPKKRFVSRHGGVPFVFGNLNLLTSFALSCDRCICCCSFTSKRGMTDSQDDRRPLIPPKKPRGGVYGATRDDSFDVERDLPTDGSVTPVDSRSDDGQGKDVDSVKQGQKFRDIWVLCLGLFSA
jgi:hypothetical protein